MLLMTLIGCVVSGAMIFAVFAIKKKQAAGSVLNAIKETTSRIETADKSIQAQLASSANLGSKAQLTNITSQSEEAKNNLSKEKDLLKEIEAKLDTVQKAVETKESQHQDMKSAKEDDEAKLTELLASYETISQESIELEQKLAASLKSLDSIMESTPMNDGQKAVLTELSNTLTNAGARMRDLVTEYNLVKERLDSLGQQHKDLEEEYTRLVEQQLGE